MASPISLEQRKATYEAAHTAFKRHENWGWHLMVPFMVEATAEGLTPMEEQENATIQEGIDTYHKLHAELKRAKQAYKKAKAKENRHSTTASETSENYTPSEPIPSEVIGEVVVESYPPYEPAPAPKPYEQLVHEHWQSQNTHFYTALRKFRRFYAKNGLATFQVLKDGANYEGMSLDVEKLTVAGLRLWASILQAPYASKLRRTQLEALLRPVLDALATGPTASRWAYL
jgi:ribosomal protein S21